MSTAARARATSAPATGASTSDACVGCGGALGALERVTSVRALGGCWHARCFRCDDCGEQLRGVFGGGGEYVVTGKPGEDRRLFHARCYRERHRPTCCVCAACIPSRDGYIHFETTPYWGEISCVEHATDGTNRCDGCRRYEKRGGEEYIAAPDGRTLCLECVQTVVIDTKDAEPLYRDILDFFGTYGLSALGTGGELPPLYLCTQDVINHVDGKKNGTKVAPRRYAVCACRTSKRYPPSTDNRLGNHPTRDQCSTSSVSLTWSNTASLDRRRKKSPPSSSCPVFLACSSLRFWRTSACTCTSV